MPTIWTPNAWFERKVDLALAFWRKHFPSAVTAHLAYVKQRRDEIGPKGLTKEDSYYRGPIPKTVYWLLNMTENESVHRTGIPFGCGKQWSNDEALKEIFWKRFREGMTTTYEGVPRFDN